MIPSKFTCDGQDLSPPINWENIPPETKSFALIMDDPDAPIGIWAHWIIFNIPSSNNYLEENVEKAERSIPGFSH